MVDTSGLKAGSTLAELLVDESPDALLALTLDGRILTWNRGAQRLLGYAAEESLGQTVEEMVVPDEHRAEWRGALAEAVATGRTALETVRRRKDGSLAHVAVTMHRIAGVDAEPFIAMSEKDVTQLDRLKASHVADEKFRSFLEAAPDAMVMVGGDGRIQLVNGQTEQLFGYRRDELLGQPIEMLVPPRFRDGHRGQRATFFADPRTRPMGTRGNLFGVRKDGSEFPAEILLSPTPVGNGMQVTAAIRDITERKLLDLRIQQASRLKNEFLAHMSHELRTPLNAIIGFAELMHGGRVGPLSPTHEEYMGDILVSSRHLLRLINDVLDLAKVESGKIEFCPEQVDVPTLVGEVRDILRELAASKRVRLGTELQPMSATIDPGRVKQVLYNYLSNAIKFTGEGGRVTIRVAPEGPDMFRLEVEDTGIGISDSDLSKLFVQFEQLDAGAAKTQQGTGLGLALTKRIVEAHGGRVEVRSVLGSGSTFSAILPRVAAAGQGETRPTVTYLAPPHAPAVLVIEDDRRDREWLQRTLREGGYHVEAAATGAEAIAMCGRRRFHAITLDMLLPDMHGWEVLRKIRSTPLNHDVPTIAVSVSTSPQRTSAFRLHDYLVKPVNEHALLASLRNACVPPGAGGPILAVDGDPATLALIEATLGPVGYRTVCATDAEAALRAAAAELPAIVVVDPFLPGMDAFDFVSRFRKMPDGDRVPIVVLTPERLSADARTQLRSAAAKLVPGRRAGTGALFEELRPLLVAMDACAGRS
jgi:PAS domain S-box-containing protein